MNRLQGSRVVVVGGSSGIGLATAKRALDEGATVAIVSRSSERLREAERVLGHVDVVVADVVDDVALAHGLGSFERIDHVFVCAGGPVGGPVLDTNLDVWRPAVEERLWGALHVVRQAAPRMIQGSITLTSGSFGSRPMPGTAMTAALAGALEGLTRALALELAPLRVNAIAPGPVDTSLLRSVLGPSPEHALHGIASSLPARRVGTPENVADVVVMLMTNSFVTGEIVHVDGGARIA